MSDVDASSAFLDGYLYPFSAVISCGLIGVCLLLVARRWLSPANGQALYLGLSAVGVAAGLRIAMRIRSVYDSSMLNWRMVGRRRIRSKGVLDKL